MLKYLKNQKLKVFISLVSAVIGNLSMVITPFFLGKAIDAMVGVNQVDLNSVETNLKFALLFFVISFIFIWISNNVSFVISADVVTNIRGKIQNKMSVLPLNYLDTHSHGSLANMISNDSDLILDGLFQLLSQILGGLVVIVVATLFMLQINTTMTLVVYLSIPFVYITSYLVSKYSIDAYKKQQSLAGKLNGFVTESIHNHQLILNTNYQPTVLKKFNDLNDEYNVYGQKAQFISSLTNPTARIVNNISYAVLGLMGAYTILSGNLTVGFFTSFISYSMMFSKPFNELSANLSQVFAARAGLATIESLLNEPEIIDEGHLETIGEGDVNFKNVDFSYRKDTPLIKNLSLSVEKRQKVAIVGPTGAGKSTLINILLRFYEVNDGTVMIDDHNIYDLSRKALRQNISVVLQEPWLFEGSIFENIRYGKPNASLVEVIEAAKKADCHHFIESLDQGYETWIQRGASNISKGQKQMITIARALLSGGPILILDEATSNIDSLTEKRIQTVFTEIMKEHTSFFVAHRLSTVMDSDVILVMRDGEIVETGTHHELIEQNGFYKTLYESQF